MKAYVLVDDFIKELNQKYKGEMTDICLMPLGVENWLRERTAYPVQLNIHSKETPDSELDMLIEELQGLCDFYENNKIRHFQTDCCRRALRYLEQLRLIKGEYARVFLEESHEPIN